MGYKEPKHFGGAFATSNNLAGNQLAGLFEKAPHTERQIKVIVERSRLNFLFFKNPNPFELSMSSCDEMFLACGSNLTLAEETLTRASECQRYLLTT